MKRTLRIPALTLVALIVIATAGVPAHLTEADVAANTVGGLKPAPPR